jgi:hypothetical protein
LKKKSDLLLKNISCLYNTAKTELEAKNKEIEKQKIELETLRGARPHPRNERERPSRGREPRNGRDQGSERHNERGASVPDRALAGGTDHIEMQEAKGRFEEARREGERGRDRQGRPESGRTREASHHLR